MSLSVDMLTYVYVQDINEDIVIYMSSICVFDSFDLDSRVD